MTVLLASAAVVVALMMSLTGGASAAGEDPTGVIYSCTDYGYDMDGNGLYDYLAFDVTLNVPDYTYGMLHYSLMNGDGLSIAENSIYMSMLPGINGAFITIPGQYLVLCGYPAPYTMALDLTTWDATYTATYATQTYGLDQFDRAILLPPITIDLADANGNGKYETMTVGSGVEVTASGMYDVVAAILDDYSNVVAEGRSYLYLTPASTEVSATIQGQDIADWGAEGTYTLYFFLAVDGYVAAMTDNSAIEIDPADFEPIVAFTGIGFDQGVDDNDDGQYDRLEVTVSIDVALPGVYSVVGQSAWGYTEVREWFDMGVHEITFQFDGFNIWMSGLDGPYFIDLRLTDENYNTLSYSNYWTSSYLAAEFKHILFDFHIGADGHTLNLASNGVVSMALYGSGWFDVRNIYMEYVTLTDGTAYAQPWQCSFKDMNKDGYTDLMLKFRTSDLFSSPTGPFNPLYLCFICDQGFITLAIGPVDASNPPVKNEIVALGTLGGSSSYGNDINDRGQVVGASFTAESPDYNWHAFSWTQAGGMADLNPDGAGYSNARAINDKGDIVGYYYLEGGIYDRGCLWTSSGELVDLGALWGDELTVAYPRDINNNGMIVGYAYTYDEILAPTYFVGHAVVWTNGPDGYTCKDIGTLPGGDMAWALGVNDKNEVVGMSATRASMDAPMEYHAFLWTENGGMVDLGRLESVSAQEMCIASCISNNGRIVGNYHLPDYSGAPTTPDYGFSVSAKGHDLSPVDSLGGYSSYVQGINAHGDMAGAAWISAYYQRHAVLWDSSHGPMDLGTLPGGWDSYATNINSRGMVVGTSSWSDETGGGYQAVIWKT